MPQHGVEECLLAWEVPVDEGPGHPCILRDGAHGDPCCSIAAQVGRSNAHDLLLAICGLHTTATTV